MKVKIPGHMDLEDLSHALQMAVAQLQDKGVKCVTGCNFYFTPTDEEGNEVVILDNKKKPIKEMVVKLENRSSINSPPDY
jgi:hypothetical protein